jgi:hypothetical protein
MIYDHYYLLSVANNSDIIGNQSNRFCVAIFCYSATTFDASDNNQEGLDGVVPLCANWGEKSKFVGGIL